MILGRKTRTQATVSREVQFGQALQNRTLPAALIANNNELGETDIFPYIASEEFVNLLKHS